MSEITLNSVFSQLGLRKIAFYGSSYFGNDIYYLKEFIDLMINVVGEEKIIEMLKADKSNRNQELGKNWVKVKNNLKKLDKLIEMTKSAYDRLEDKTMKKNDDDYKRFVDKAKRIPMIKQDIYSLFVFLVNSTSIKNQSIPSEYFKILEHKGFRAVGELEKRRVGDEPKKIE